MQGQAGSCGRPAIRPAVAVGGGWVCCGPRSKARFGVQVCTPRGLQTPRRRLGASAGWTKLTNLPFEKARHSCQDLLIRS